MITRFENMLSFLHKGSFKGMKLPCYFNHFGIILFEELQECLHCLSGVNNILETQEQRISHVVVEHQVTNVDIE